DYYCLLPWRLLFDLLPTAFHWQEEDFITLGDKEWRFLDGKSLEVLQYVKKKKQTKEERLKQEFGKEAVERLLRLGFLRRVREWKMPDLSVSLYALAVPLQEAIDGLKHFRNKEEKLRLIHYLQEREVASEEELREAGFKTQDIKALLQKGLLTCMEEDIRKVSITYTAGRRERRYIRPLGKKSILFGNWQDTLLRMEEELESLVEAGKSALIYCENVSLVEQVEEYLRPALGDRLVRLCSSDRPRDLILRWFSLNSAQGVVVVGNRGALLAPLKEVELFLCLSGNSKHTPTGVDLREFLYQLSRYYGAGFSLVSTAPPLNLYLGRDWREEYSPPTAQVFVLRRKGEEVLSPELKALVPEGEECLFLVNKTGYAYAYCKFCGWIVDCPVCGNLLTLSGEGHKVFCNLCGYKGDALCPECGRPLQKLGFGIDRAVEEVYKHLGVRENFHFDTQPRLGKSYDWVFVLHADNLLSLPRFDAMEKYFSYLWSALCISRRGLVVQTAVEDNPLVEYIKSKDWQGFYEKELSRRKEEDLPPYRKMVVAILRSAPDMQSLGQEARKKRAGKLFEVLVKTDSKNLRETLRILRRHQPVYLEVL
ncbi:MAG: hypothetical protein N3C13_04895, partial [Aquificaceae bacterium]|nr:hypothetical protein [Aquificaceae bacterium]